MSTRFLQFLLFILFAILLLPASGQTSRRGRQQPGTGPGGATPGDVLIKFEGTLTFANKKEIRIDVEGDQSLDFRVIKKTVFYRGKTEITAKDLVVNSHITIEGRKELNGDLNAVNVYAEESGESKDDTNKK